MKRIIIGVLLGLVFGGRLMAAELVPVGSFSDTGLDGWKEKSFVGNTQYRLQDSAQGKILHASTEASASGLFRELSIDLEKTPWLNWSWRVANTFVGNDEQSKQGDDYPARIYVVVSGGLLFWQTRAINYVWSSHQPQGSEWPNAFTKNARMIALQSGNKHVHEWREEKRNVRQDLQRLFGKDFKKIHAVAIMVDADNTGQKAASDFGDIWFSAD